MIRFTQLAIARAGKPLFSGASLTIHPGERIALIGPNGSGKSSLIAALRGEVAPDAGNIEIPALRTGWLAQHMPSSLLSPVRFVMNADTRLVAAEAAVTAAEAGGDGDAIGHAYQDWIDADGPSAEARAAELLSGLGFDATLLSRRVDDLSGGWKMRLNLACVLMAPADLLLLDEPTNHLDLDAVLWLERQLLRHPAIQIIVSHDRDFLDRVATACLVIADGILERFAGGYSASELVRAERTLQRHRERRAQQARVDHLTSFVERFRAKASKARQAQSRLKALERMELMAPVRASRGIEFSFAQRPPGPDPLIRAEGLLCGYDPAAPIVRVPELIIRRGARIGILGRNGGGKTTLIRTLVGTLPALGGERVAASTLDVGYLAQQQVDSLRDGESALQHMVRLAPAEREQTLRGWLGQFAFSGDDAMRPVGPMSGGEKARLCLAMLAWRKPGFLVLDEPTNHLDAATRDALADALAEFDGPLVLVSHDRYLLRATVDEFWLIDDGVLRLFDGDLDDYAQWLQRRGSDSGSAERPAAMPDRSATGATATAATTAATAAAATGVATAAARAAPPAPQPSAGRDVASRRDRARERAELAGRRKPVEQRIRRIETLMARQQARAVELDALLARPDAFDDRDAATERGRERARIAAELQQLEDEWLEQQGELERIDAAAAV